MEEMQVRSTRGWMDCCAQRRRATNLEGPLRMTEFSFPRRLAVEMEEMQVRSTRGWGGLLGAKAARNEIGRLAQDDRGLVFPVDGRGGQQRAICLSDVWGFAGIAAMWGSPLSDGRCDVEVKSGDQQLEHSAVEARSMRCGCSVPRGWCRNRFPGIGFG
jgi:hypothetical protein